MSLFEGGVLLGVAAVSLIPFERVFLWVFGQARDIESKLDKPAPPTYFSKYPLAVALAKLCHFFKGYIPVSIALNYFYYSDLLVLLSIGMVCILHQWVLAGVLRQKSSSILLVLWGIYSALYLPLLIVVPLCFVLFALIFDAYVLGVLLSVLTCFFLYWYLQLETLFLFANTLLFIFLFLTYIRQTFQFFEGKKTGLLELYRCRKIGF